MEFTWGKKWFNCRRDTGALLRVMSLIFSSAWSKRWSRYVGTKPDSNSRRLTEEGTPRRRLRLDRRGERVHARLYRRKHVKNVLGMKHSVNTGSTIDLEAPDRTSYLNPPGGEREEERLSFVRIIL